MSLSIDTSSGNSAVGQFKDVGDTSLPEGPIEPPTPLSEFRFNYSKEFLSLALRPPGYYKSWHIGFVLRASKKLVAFITGVPREYGYLILQPPLGSGRWSYVIVPAVTRLLRNYLSQFVVSPDFEENDVEHWLLPTEGVVDSYLVESPETHDVTDFCSFYTLPSSILGTQNYSILKAAYSYYNVSTKTPLLQLMNDALIVATQKDFDVFNALDVMHNESFLKDLKFGPGDGQNFTTTSILSRIRNALRPSELGLVTL
ncbi:hypothetical protein GQ457_HM000680 [Hibiscus cannabinus]